MEFQGATSSDSAEDNAYELLSIVIHVGGAHGGHYHAYIRDLMAQVRYFSWMTVTSRVVNVCLSKGHHATMGIPTEAGDDVQCWYDFNDSNVQPISTKKLAK